MADAYGSMKSNSFKVDSIEALDFWMKEEGFQFGNAEPQIVFDKYVDDGVYVTICDPDAQYPDAIPMIIEDSDEREAIEEFVTGLRKIMPKDQAFCLMAQSNEKAISQVCTRFVVTHSGYRIDNFDPDLDTESIERLVNERNDE